MKVQKELLAATGLKANKGEEPTALRLRVLKAADALEDAEYEKLSKESQEWIGKAVKAQKSKKALPPFDVEDDDADLGKPAAGKSIKPVKAAKKEAEEEAEEEEKKPAKAGKATKPAKAAKEGDSLAIQCRKWVVNNLTLNIKQLKAKSDEKDMGFSQAAIARRYLEVHQLMPLLQAKGLLVKEYVKPSGR